MKVYIVQQIAKELNNGPFFSVKIDKVFVDINDAKSFVESEDKKGMISNIDSHMCYVVRQIIVAEVEGI